MAFQLGDKVQVLDEDATGVIVGFVNTNTVLVEIDEFEFPYLLSQLILVDANNKVIQVIDDGKISTPVIPSPHKVVNHYNIDPLERVNKLGQPEIDLHIEELVSAPGHLSAHKKLQIQINALEQFISSCAAQHICQFVVIHGVGQGVLKTEVKKVLHSHGNIVYQEADFRLYGSGATFAQIKGLFS